MRPTLSTLGLTCLALAGLGCGPARSAPVFQLQAGAAHAGVFPAASGPADSLGGIAWRFPTGGIVRASPVCDGATVYCGSSDGTFYALDAHAGTERWHHDTGSSIGDAAAVAQGTVVFGVRDGRVIALDAVAGRLRWTARTGPDRAMPWGHEGFDFWTSSPAIGGATVYIGSGDGNLYALDLASGHVRWRAATDGRVRSSPAVLGGAVYVGSCDGGVYAFDAATGARRWRFDTDGHGFDSAKFGYDRKSVYAPPTVADGHVFVGGRDGRFYALDAATGKEQWRVDFGTSWVMGAAAVRDGRVVVSTSDGHQVRALAEGDGKEAWRFETTSALWASPGLSGNLALVTDWGGDVIALDVRTGKEAWRQRLPRAVLTAAWPAADRVYVAGDDGGVYALARSRQGLARAVYWDSTLAGSPKAMQGNADVRDYFRRMGYRALDGTGLVAFLAARIADGAPSVVVCALDGLPAAATDAAATGGACLLRRYLEAGGRIAWLGEPPLVTGDPMKAVESLDQIDARRPRAILGVDFSRGNYDPLPAYPTAEGRAWGLHGSWTAHWAVDPAGVTTVLAANLLDVQVAAERFVTP
jgi:outer membrane protein assembly factor BamB